MTQVLCTQQQLIEGSSDRSSVQFCDLTVVVLAALIRGSSWLRVAIQLIAGSNSLLRAATIKDSSNGAARYLDGPST